MAAQLSYKTLRAENAAEFIINKSRFIGYGCPCETEEELIAEGKALHHCVASYAERHARGELTIFFIRRKDKPDEPWYTLNFNEKRLSVTENRGMRNCERTDGVRNFENTWLEWVRSGRKRRISAE